MNKIRFNFLRNKIEMFRDNLLLRSVPLNMENFKKAHEKIAKVGFVDCGVDVFGEWVKLK